MSKFFLFSNIRIVKGSHRATICDLQREEVYIIPLKMVHFIESAIGLIREEIVKILGFAESYLSFLEENELCHFSSYPEHFPDLNLEWASPFSITNVVLDIRKELNIEYLISSSLSIDIPYLEIRFYASVSKAYFMKIFDFLDKKIVLGFRILYPDCPDNKELLIQKVQASAKCYSLIFYSSQSNLRIATSDSNKDILSVTTEISSEKSCGIIEKTFVPSIKVYTESLKHNSCLNRKIAIDSEGNIKNCPSMSESFGNIRDTTLLEAIEKSGFKKYWNINKDKIHVCKNCEFRYICTDCRAYVEDPDDILSKPLKCGYNPYTGEWREWSTNPLKKKAIEFYGMEEMVKRAE